MKLSSFFKLVEIQTKIASVLPFLFGTVYAYYRFEHFSFFHAIIMFSSMILFDMTVTALNNYYDYKKAIKTEGYGYETHNVITRDGLHLKSVKRVIIFMFILSTLLGLLLVYLTNLFVLILGMICFAIGIAYSYGPFPISYTPFGEVCSGLTMGFLLTLISLYIHIFDQGVIVFDLNRSHVDFFMNFSILISIFTVTLPLVTSIANIMLANNICDIEDDLANKRRTLPICVSKETSLTIYFALYIIGYAAIILAVITKLLPPISLLTLLTFVVVYQNIKKFVEVQSKQHTFILSVKNFILLNGVYIFTLLLGVIIK